jgi:hypothetical protein
VLESCLPYDAPFRPNNADLCQYKCQDRDPDVSAGTFK